MSLYTKQTDIETNLWLPKGTFSSVAQLCPTLCDPMDCSTPGFPVLIKHQIILENQVTPCHRAVRGEEMQNLMTVIQECL